MAVTYELMRSVGSKVQVAAPLDGTPRVRHLELRVEVDLAVGWVYEAVQALAGVGVEAGCVHHELVLACEAIQRDPRVRVGRRVDSAAVEGDLLHAAGDQVDECL